MLRFALMCAAAHAAILNGWVFTPQGYLGTGSTACGQNFTIVYSVSNAISNLSSVSVRHTADGSVPIGRQHDRQLHVPRHLRARLRRHPLYCCHHGGHDNLQEPCLLHCGCGQSIAHTHTDSDIHTNTVHVQRKHGHAHSVCNAVDDSELVLVVHCNSDLFDYNHDIRVQHTDTLAFLAPSP